MIDLPPITGNIRSVPLSSYKEIIDNYVDKAGKLEQVSSIIQMGSFSTPGISDIDLVVVINDRMPFPPWSEISLKDISKEHGHSEIIAHDIFVIPESIAEKAEAYFYIDQQNVLKGKKLGGNISKEMVAKCKEFLALEYAIFSLDSIATSLLCRTVNLRTLILLISTMRHSASIASDLKIINEQEKNELIKQIEKLRIDVLSSKYSLEDFSYLLGKFIRLLDDSIVTISKNLTEGINAKNLKKKWITNSKTGMIGIKEEANFLEAFLNIISRQKDSLFSKYSKVFAVPIKSQMHIGAYLDGNELAASYFKNRFNKFPVFHDKDELNTKVRGLRGKVVKQHWDFINQSGYLQSSGKAYFGLFYPGNKNLNSFIKKKMLLYQLSKF